MQLDLQNTANGNRVKKKKKGHGHKILILQIELGTIEVRHFTS